MTSLPQPLIPPLPLVTTQLQSAIWQQYLPATPTPCLRPNSLAAWSSMLPMATPITHPTLTRSSYPLATTRYSRPPATLTPPTMELLPTLLLTPTDRGWLWSAKPPEPPATSLSPVLR